MNINRSVDITLTEYEKFSIVEDFITKYPIATEMMLNIIKNKGMLCCPFPVECKKFPCSTLVCNPCATLACNCDLLENGLPYKI